MRFLVLPHCACAPCVRVRTDKQNYNVDEKIARNDGFWRAPEIDFRYETKARKMMVDFKLNSGIGYIEVWSQGKGIY